MNKDTLQNIINASGYAPSGDNSRPWRFVVKGDVIYQHFIANKDNPFLNFKNGGTLIANGAALENIFQAASDYGYRAIIENFPEHEPTTCIAKITFQKEEKISAHNKDIVSRHTNRKLYQPTPLDKEILKQLIEITTDFKNIRIVTIEDREKIQKLGEAGSKAEIIILENKILHGFLFESVKWTRNEESKNCSGLYVKTLELNPVQEFFFHKCRKWKFMNIMNKLHFAQFVASQDSKNYGSGGAYIGILIPTTSAKNFIEVGRAVERMWIFLNAKGYAVHPIVATLFLGMRVNDGNIDGLKKKHIELIKKTMIDIFEIFKPKDEKIVFMFRTGSADSAQVHSQKKPPMVSYE